jgi:predicted MFS family arabinose efflux permease
MSVQIAAVPQLSRGRLVTLVASRFVLNAIFRLTYPLVPFLALQFGVSERTVTTIITVQVALGLTSLVSGWLGDRIGYRRTMLLGLSAALLGTLGVAFAPTFGWLLIAYGLCGLGAALYLPAMQAYVSALTSYEQRGRAIGLVELSWALAGLAAVPLLLRVVQWQDGIQGAFLLLASGIVFVIGMTLALLPDEHGTITQAPVARVSPLTVVRQPTVLALCAFLFLAVGGNEILFVAQAPWATARFGADPAALGVAAFVFGVGELGGSVLSTLFTDRLGKLRASLVGFMLAALVFVALPLASGTWLGYLGIYAFYGVTIEFAIVAAITLSSTVSMHARATVMALVSVAIQIGRTLGSQLSVPLLDVGSLATNSLVAATVVLVGVWIAWRGVKESKN